MLKQCSMMTVWAVGVAESLTVPNVPEKVYAEDPIGCQ